MRVSLKRRLAMIVSALPFCGSCGFGQESDWWSLQPLTRPEVPETQSARAESPIDHFVIAKLAEQGMKMSPEADRRTLLRRLSFDLTGLPPSLEEMAEFLADESTDAYKQAVERLLASPRYGERWARHWLDIVHYADTHGYDKDKPRPNAWPYRDYVIRAFNEDKPYGRFVKEQLAGDVLWPDTVDGIVATGFIAAGPWDFIGHAEVPEEKYDGMVARHLDRDDMVATTMNAFCSFTVQCAQCHDHKKDPVTMEDYYSLQAVFAAVDRADRPYDADPETTKQRALLSKTKGNLEERAAALAEFIEQNKPEDVAVLDKEIAELETSISQFADIPGKKRSGRYGYHSQVATSQDEVKWVQVDLGMETPLDSIILKGADEYGFADFGFPHRFKLEAASTFDFSGAHLIADHTTEDFARPGALPVAFDAGKRSARYVRITATKLWSRRHAGQPRSNDWIFALGELVVIADEKILPVREVAAKDSIEAGERWAKANLVDGVFGKYPLAEAGDATRLTGWQTCSPMKLQTDLADLKEMRITMIRDHFGDKLAEKEAINVSIAEIDSKLKSLPKPQKVYAGTVYTGKGTFKGRGHVDGKPREIHVLARGDVRSPEKEVVPGTVPLIPEVAARFNLPENHAEGDRRVALAEWIAHRGNPLTWRSIVNRVWQYHFGRGIVNSANDFGKLGELPTHPELLDWLAVEFRDGGQSMKKLHRLIVNSAAYKQSSAGNPDFEKIDGGNQYLWRMNRRKLEAEVMRDLVLQVSGKLDLKMYGPGFRDFVLEKPEHSPHYEYAKHDPNDPATHRRSIYRFIVRSQPQPLMNTLDCADPTLLVDKRNETLTALQALALMNNKFVVSMADQFAKRMESERDSPESRIALAWQLVLNRAPSPEESVAMVDYTEKHGLAAACRIILNLNEAAFAD